MCFVERDAFAAALLVARMEGAALDCAPVWDDLASFDAGAWLCALLGWGEGEYLASFTRVNLLGCSRWWSARAALLDGVSAGDVVLLGARVSAAFLCEGVPLWSRSGRFVRVPHPSGRSREWNAPGARERLRELLEPYRWEVI